MGYILCTTEKPNVAQEIAKFLGANAQTEHYYIGNGYIVTWCIGHLIRLCYPDEYDPKFKKWQLETLPFFLDGINGWKTAVIEETKGQYEAIKQLMHREDVDYIIDCGDAGREGCNIQDLVRKEAGCTKKVKRLWISSLTEQSIRDGFNNLHDIEEYENVTKAAFARMLKDYIVGINATRGYTAKYGNGTVLNCGMAQTPTLALIVNRYEYVRDFQEEEYYVIHAELENGFSVTYKKETEERLTFAKAKALIAEMISSGNVAIVSNIKIAKKKVERPLLLDLNELQREANKKYQYSAKEVLDVAQNLYEKKLITYPRTGSSYLSTDMQTFFTNTLDKIIQLPQYKTVGTIFQKKGYTLDERIFCNDYIKDHHAIIATENIIFAQWNTLDVNEKNILKLIVDRMLIVAAQSYIYEETKVVFSVGEYKFIGSQRITKRTGWKSVELLLSENEIKGNSNAGNRNGCNLELNELKEGDKVSIKKIYQERKKTSLPKLYNEAELIYTMQNIARSIPDKATRELLKGHGIGTEATRADIIEGLIKNGYVQREKKQKVIYLSPTQKGLNLISIMPPELKNFVLSAEWEKMLDEIEIGAMDPEEFLTIVREYTVQLIDNIKNSKEIRVFDDEPVGICPRCKQYVFEEKSSFLCESKYGNNFCGFCVYKMDRYFTGKTNVPLKRGQMRLLLEGKTFKASCISKTKGSHYDALFHLVDKGMYVNVELKEFVSKYNEKNKDVVV